MIQPRLLRRAQVLELLNVRSSTLARWIERGIIPPPIDGTARWDRLAIERALDRAGQVAEPSPPSLAERASRWEKSRCA